MDRSSRLGHVFRWRAVGGLAGGAAGLLLVTSAVTSRGIGLRANDTQDLGALASSSADQYRRVAQQRQRLTEEVAALSNQNLSTSPALLKKLRALEDKSGLRPVSGPGVTVTLDDAPPDKADAAAASGVDVSALLVHQQDIQAVMNALWAGGAQGVTVQGQRVISTTGVICVGNSVVLQGVPYAPPYLISAVGPPSTMLSELYADPWIKLYLHMVPQGLKWDATVLRRLDLPAYTGSLQLHYARPMEPTSPQ